MKKPNRYPKNWKAIASFIKCKANWKCQKCGMECLKPFDDISCLTKSEIAIKTLTVHHWNNTPEDNRIENLAALCSGCHLSYHHKGQSRVTPGQLSLFSE